MDAQANQPLEYSENVCCDFRIFWDRSTTCALYQGHQTIDQDFKDNDEDVFYSMVFQHQKLIDHYGPQAQGLMSIKVM